MPTDTDTVDVIIDTSSSSDDGDVKNSERVTLRNQIDCCTPFPRRGPGGSVWNREPPLSSGAR
jgi:hypothetical protein